MLGMEIVGPTDTAAGWETLERIGRLRRLLQGEAGQPAQGAKHGEQRADEMPAPNQVFPGEAAGRQQPEGIPDRKPADLRVRSAELQHQISEHEGQKESAGSLLCPLL